MIESGRESGRVGERERQKATCKDRYGAKLKQKETDSPYSPTLPVSGLHLIWWIWLFLHMHVMYVMYVLKHRPKKIKGYRK